MIYKIGQRFKSSQLTVVIEIKRILPNTFEVECIQRLPEKGSGWTLGEHMELHLEHIVNWNYLFGQDRPES